MLAPADVDVKAGASKDQHHQVQIATGGDISLKGFNTFLQLLVCMSLKISAVNCLLVD